MIRLHSLPCNNDSANLQTETFQINPSAPTHGSSGPLRVSYGGHYAALSQQWLDVAKKYDNFRPFVEDGQDFRTANAYFVSESDPLCESDIVLTTAYSERNGQSKRMHILC
jgi:hypothetical protein